MTTDGRVLADPDGRGKPPDCHLPSPAGTSWRQISTSTVAILREHYGRGPMKAKTYALDDIIVVVMRGTGFTPFEQTVMDDDGAERVIAMRHDFQRMMADRYKAMIEELTDRTVVACLSQAHVEPDITMEIFDCRDRRRPPTAIPGSRRASPRPRRRGWDGLGRVAKHGAHVPRP